jgi:putative thioredoxin
VSETPFAFDIGAENFQQYVLENSYKVPVLVDFWAEWCAPCKTLKPILESLAAEYNGQFLLAKVNSDNEQALAQQFGVRSLPTVKVFRNGEIVDEFMGAQPEPVIRQLLEQHIERESDRLAAEALLAAEDGNHDLAQQLFQQAHDLDPANHRVTTAMARLLIDQGETEQAEQMLQSLPPAQREDTEVRTLLAQINIRKATSDAPDAQTLEQRILDDPDDLKARLQLANISIAGNDYETGMEHLLEIMKRDRGFEDDAGRKGLINCFEMLGGEGELVSAYRRKMSMLLH